MSDDDVLKNKPAFSIGQSFEPLSLEDIDLLISTLESEIIRLQHERKAKEMSRSAAHSLFRK